MMAIIFTISYVFAINKPNSFVVTFLMVFLVVIITGGFIVFSVGIGLIRPTRCRICKKSFSPHRNAKFCSSCRQILKTQLVDHIGTIKCKLCETAVNGFSGYKNHYEVLHNNGMSDDSLEGIKISNLEENGKRMYSPF